MKLASTLLLALALVASAVGQTALPDAPTPALKSITWKQTFDKKFILLHALWGLSVAWDEHETLRGESIGCAWEGNSGPAHRAGLGSLAKSDWALFAGGFAFDLFLRKVGVKYVWAGLPLVETGVRAKAITDWHTFPGCY